MSDTIVNAEFDWQSKDVAQATAELAQYLTGTFDNVDGGFLQAVITNAQFNVLDIHTELNRVLAGSTTLLRVCDFQQQGIDNFIIALRVADIHEALGFF